MERLLSKIRTELKLKQKQKRLATNELDYQYYKGEVDMIKELLQLIKDYETRL